MHLAFSLHGNAPILTLQRLTVVLWVRVAKNLYKREKAERSELLSFLQSNASLSEVKEIRGWGQARILNWASDKSEFQDIYADMKPPN